MHWVLALFQDELHSLLSPNGPWWQIVSILEAVSHTTRCQQKIFSAPWVNSSNKSVPLMALGSNVSQCRLCFAVTCDFCLTCDSYGIWLVYPPGFDGQWSLGSWMSLLFLFSAMSGSVWFSSVQSLLAAFRSPCGTSPQLVQMFRSCLQTSLGRLWPVGSSLIWVNLEVDQYVGQFVDMVLRRLKQLRLCDWQSHVRGEIMSRLLFL